MMLKFDNFKLSVLDACLKVFIQERIVECSSDVTNQDTLDQRQKYFELIYMPLFRLEREENKSAQDYAVFEKVQ